MLKSHSLFISFIIIFVAACEQRHEAPNQPVKPSETTSRIIIAAVGDVMMPGSVQAAVARNRHNYGLLFDRIATDLGDADVTFANLETTIDHKEEVAGYPRFNARPELLKAMKLAGVDMVSIANNHAMDAGTGGLVRTLDNIEAAGLFFIGAGRTKTEAAEIRRITVRGMTVAFLAYTYSTNEPLPRKRQTAPGVNILLPDSAPHLEKAIEDIQQARRSADLVAVSLHWGDEYEESPSAWQKRVASEMIEAGADIILGHHPHVLQPINTHAAKDGRQGIIAYSLGNFISSQNSGVSYGNRAHARALRGDGIILRITAVKENGKTGIERVEFLPIWTLREKAGNTIMSRPVSLGREIARLQAIGTRSLEQENTIRLLSYRKKIITDKLTITPEAR